MNSPHDGRGLPTEASPLPDSQSLLTEARSGDPAGTRVLVVIVNNRRDLDIAREQRWYRIPVNRAPPRIGADYLALYQTAAFGDEKWAVRYYAPIRRYRLVTRAELLPDEPGHPRVSDRYYKIEIGPLCSLPSPIPSRRFRRLTFIPTTLEKLLSAEEINDLWDRGVAEDRLWAAFKEVGFDAERQWEVRERTARGNPSCRPCVVDFAVFCPEGPLAVMCEGSDPWGITTVRERATPDYDLAAAGWTVLRFDRQRLQRDMRGCVAEVREVYDGARFRRTLT